MRVIKRWLKRGYAELRLRTRRAQLEDELTLHFSRELYLERSGSRGRDCIYQVVSGATVLGMLRVNNPHLYRKPLAAEMPFVELDGPDRLAREWNCYAQGVKADLTPRPLWRSSDAILCDYVHGRRLSDQLFERPEQFWVLLERTSHRIAQLHCAGITHMDVSLANVVEERATRRLVFIDFEYGPAPGLSVPAQQAYDYLRLVESSIKFLPTGLSLSSAGWLAALAECVPVQARSVDLNSLRPALGRVLADEAICTGLASIFTDLQRR